MGWASRHIERLQAGEAVQFRPTGHSMRGKVESGQLVTVVPMGITPDSDPPIKGDVVLCRVRGREYLRLIKAVVVRGMVRRGMVRRARMGAGL